MVLLSYELRWVYRHKSTLSSKTSSLFSLLLYLVLSFGQYFILLKNSYHTAIELSNYFYRVWTMNLLPSTNETLDAFFNGKLKILQRKRGYRFSVDALLLSQFIKIRKNEKAIDLGTGCGILPLLLSQTTRAHSFVAVEIQKGLAELAKKNVSLNNLDNKVSILYTDFRELKTWFHPGCFDVVFSNPPYRKYRTGRVNPILEKAIARHEIKGTLEDLISIASYLLPFKGRCYLIYPASRVVDLLFHLRVQRLEPKRLQLVYPRFNEEAKFVLIESVKASGVELKMMQPLILHET
jgi:tRNA1Val (adenine37-N6)-methyltransferase